MCWFIIFPQALEFERQFFLDYMRLLVTPRFTLMTYLCLDAVLYIDLSLSPVPYSLFCKYRLLVRLVLKACFCVCVCFSPFWVMWGVMIGLVWLFGFVGSLSYFTGMCCASCCMGYLHGLYSSGLW